MWKALDGASAITQLAGELYRLVESQEQVATNSLVDDLEEQAILENIIERSKPAITAGLHYLLFTPFRYPPLKHGSRFGSRLEKSLFYGSQQIITTLWEAAYYRMVFWAGMASPPPSGIIRSEHTLFTAQYHATRGVKLQEAPFLKKQRTVCHPSNYEGTQLLGTRMREEGVEAFEYCSARDPGKGINIALFTAKTFSKKKPQSIQPWICTTQNDEVSFFNKEEEVYRMEKITLLKNGRLPMPAV